MVPGSLGGLLANVFQWFAGGDEHPYMRLTHCMNHDTFWIAATVTLDAVVACGYGVITWHWYKNGRHLPDTPAKRALGNMRNIFLFCCICGYVFIPVKMFWPAWRLYDVFMLGLGWFTWRYAMGAKDLKVIYNEVGRSTQLAADLARTKEESKRKTFFLNAVSHDLRTPLNGLMLQASLAEIGIQSNDPETIRDAVGEIKACAKATAELLDNFLDYARVDWAGDRNTITTFELPALLQEVVHLSVGAAEARGLYVRANCPPRLPVETDRVKLSRVLNNLVTNGLKFTDRGGVRIEVERTGSAVEIHVIDSGIGIAADVQGQLFDEFFQAQNDERDRRKGFGLGLTIAQRLARQLGGDVTVDSAPGKGSRFSVALPGVVCPEAAGLGSETFATAAVGT